MNLSEIRKKAQQEKTGSADVAAPREQALPAETGAVEKQVEPAPEFFPEYGREEFSPVPLSEPEEELQGFDPLAVLLAGRAAAGGVDEMQTGGALAEYADGAVQELLCFRVAAEKYAVNIMDIKE